MVFDLENFLPYRLYQAAEHTSRGFHRYYRERYGIHQTEWRVLVNIDRYGPIRAAEISRRSGLEKTKISRAVVGLEARGWVGRKYLENDRRTHQLVLTVEGTKILAELKEMAGAYQAKLKTLIGERATKDLLKITRALEQSEVDFGED